MHIETAHRPWPAPDRRWAMFMRWHDLLFMHWPVPPKALRPLVPTSLELDTYDGQAWLGVVPFRMSGTRPRLLPPVPGVSAFPELNLRTYVTAGGKPGVWFFSLDAASRVAVRVARKCLNLPYFDADMACEPAGDVVRYRSTRTHRDAPPAEFVGQYGPTAAGSNPRPGKLDYFLTERYCLYGVNHAGRAYRLEIAHAPWLLRPAEAQTEVLRMTEQIGVALPDDPPLLHFGGDQDVIGWSPELV